LSQTLDVLARVATKNVSESHQLASNLAKVHLTGIHSRFYYAIFYYSYMHFLIETTCLASIEIVSTVIAPLCARDIRLIWLKYPVKMFHIIKFICTVYTLC